VRCGRAVGGEIDLHVHKRVGDGGTYGAVHHQELA